MAAVVVVALGLGVVGVVRTGLAPDQVAAVVAGSRPGVILAAIALMTFDFVVLALRWRALIPTDRPTSVLGLVRILTVGLLLNYALTGAVGEPATAALVQRRFGVPAEAAFAGNVLGRFLGLGVAAAIAFAAVGFTDVPVDPEWRPAVAAVAGAVVVVAGGLGMVATRPEWIMRLADRTVGRFARFRHVHGMAYRFAEAVGHAGRLGPRRWAEAVGWAFVGHAVVIAGTALACVGVGASPDVGGVAFTYGMVTAGAVVLFAFPGSQAGWDVLLVTLLVKTAGVPLAAATAAALTVRLQQVLVTVIGAVALLLEGRDGIRGRQG